MKKNVRGFLSYSKYLRGEPTKKTFSQVECKPVWPGEVKNSMGVIKKKMRIYCKNTQTDSGV
jgi:hypothetical protein